ncbi:hypothetical protein EWI61_08785 [Methylolobus aquaticus]|nr:hypothetical protein EWI61_08785 [Methylolobus aquaticus]
MPRSPVQGVKRPDLLDLLSERKVTHATQTAVPGLNREPLSTGMARPLTFLFLDADVPPGMMPPV